MIRIIMALLLISSNAMADEYYSLEHLKRMKPVTYKVLFPCETMVKSKKDWNEYLDNFSGTIFALTKDQELKLLKKHQVKELRAKQLCLVKLLTKES